MWRAVELSDVHDIVFVFEYGGLVVVDIEVVRCAKYRHHAWEARRPGFTVHAISGVLGFVCSNDGKEIVFFEESACGGIGEEVGASSDMVVNEEFRCLFLTELLERIGPEDVAHQAMGWWFSEAVNLLPLALCQICETKLTDVLEVIQGI